MDNQDYNKKFIVTFNTSEKFEKTLLNEYDNLVKISYGNVPMNVTSVIGHHVTVPLPKNCTYIKKK
jgi:hypothetical protein